MQKLIYKLRNNKKGMASLEFIIGMIIFLIVVCFMMDLLILMWKFNVISQTNTQIARIAGIQGGVRTSTPSGYPGGSAAYISISELDDIISDKFEGSGIDSNEWLVRVGDRKSVV